MNLDREAKIELARTAVPNLLMPLGKAVVNHKLTMKQMDRQQEVALEIAEREAEKTRELARVAYGGGAAPAEAPQQPGGRSRPVGESEQDVYDELERIKQETDCEFCYNVADSLMDAPTSEARQGADELRTYLREVERIEGQDDMTEARAEEIVHDLVDRWEVVPQHAAGMA